MVREYYSRLNVLGFPVLYYFSTCVSASRWLGYGYYWVQWSSDPNDCEHFSTYRELLYRVLIHYA